MALDREYFDAIHIDLVKKKYYNANKVEAVLEEIRQRAQALNEENEALRRELGELRERRGTLGDSMLSAQAVYRRIIEKANERADEILSDARRESAQLRRASQQQQEFAAQQVEQCISRVRQMQMTAIEELNAEWQRFLCGLYPEEQPDTPADLTEKVDAIARELQEINSGD